LGDYPVTPEAHMRGVRRLGEAALDEAEAALGAARKNREEAESIRDAMRAYKLLADYYERKVLAAACGLIVGLGGGPAYKAEAEGPADRDVELYEKAITFIWEKLDRKSGTMKGRWDGKAMTLPELIEREKKERKELAKLFRWPDR